MIIFEGQLGPSTARADSWAWDPAKRTWKSIGGLEGDLPTCAMDYYGSVGTSVCFVGSRWTYMSKGEGRNVSETWTYGAMADKSNLLETVGSPTPGLLGSRVAWDPVSKRIWLCGGGPRRNMPMNEPWYWDLAKHDWFQIEREL
ncbi:MAG TPA: hypothetical protein VMX33_03090 [bacterium]|nr:hypothetical protein [bacterium]